MVRYPVRRFLLMLGLGLITFARLNAQQSGMVRGIVRDSESHQALVGALVVVSADKSSGAVTDLRGFYELKLPAGQHTLICSFLGMASDTFSVTVVHDGILVRDISLKALVTDMNVVVISAGKYEQNINEITVSMQVLPSQLIERRNTVNIKSALEQVPGLVILDEEPQMRGGSGFSFGVGSRVATMIDGLPIMTGDAGRTDWNFIPTENIEQVEIVEGASSVLYGSSALSGTINFLTRYPKDSGLTYIRTYTGFYSTPRNDSAKWWDGHANFSGINFSSASKFKQMDLVVGGQASYDHNYIGPYVLDGSIPIKADTLDNSDVADRSGRLNINFRYRSKKLEGFSAGIHGNAMKAHTNFSLVWGNSTDGIYRAFPGTMTISDFTAFYLDPFATYFTPRGGKHSLKSRYYFSDNDNNSGQANSTRVYMAEYSYSKAFRSLGNLKLITGLFVNDAYSTANLYSGSGDPDNHVKNRSAFLQADKEFFKAVRLSAGVRGEYFRINSEDDEMVPVFRSGLNVRITKGTHFRMSYGQGYRYPTLAEKFIITTTGGIYVFPNPSIKPESSWSTEAGIKQGFKVGNFLGFADIAFFQQEYHNTIEYVYAIWQPDSAGFKFVNTGDTRVKGFEVSVMGGGRLFREFGMNVLIGYTYVEPVTQNPNEVFATDNPAEGILPTPLTYVNTSTDTTGNILKYRFRHLVKADVEFTYKRLAAGISGRYYSFMENIDKTFYDLDQPYLLPTGIREYREDHDDGSLVFDGRISCRLWQHYSVAVISNNLFNLEYSLRPLKIEAPRTVAVQLTAKF